MEQKVRRMLLTFSHLEIKLVFCVFQYVCSLYGGELLRHYELGFFDVHTAVHLNIISIVKPTRCTNVSNLFYFRTTLYMFRTVLPSIIRSSRLYIQQQSYVKQILLSHSSICLTY